MDHQTLTYLSAFIAGLALGLFYFAGLWVTLKRLPHKHSPARFILTSFLARAAVVTAGFYLIMDGQWQRLVICLLGFMITRSLMLRILGPEKIPGQAG